jgi:ABC-type nitrate/sulfonate/bicarbonate transport system permease component
MTTSVPEAGTDARTGSPASSPDPDASASAFSVYGWAVLRAFAPLVVSAIVAVIVWEAFLRLFDINPLIGKTPGAVWTYMFTAPEAAANRTAVFDPLGTTLRDASVGFVAGMIAAIAVAVGFVLFRSVEQAFMPIAMLLRSVPLVAMTPLITLIFGRGLAGVSVIAGIVVFFPALVTVVFGLRSVNPQSHDLVVAYGGSEFTVLRKLAFPTAMPAIFAAARISVPGALIGALVAEWLATGKGTGGVILRDIGAFGYGNLWASIVSLTAFSILLYTLVGLVETFVLARFGPAPASH